ncbi:hypothetical protein RUESEDTHA_03177 [Ruegeria sp. THAF57]|uniref:COG3904 family protein n=1 Tax=Ruegeria sp. THAF57 TaxID=2744555 RepID=UPI0015DDBE81|nr:hypothetical protein [Ruegeria sp. THAF57]CAD0186270.1 hypothetical protein RUESEDTHA_03177 [Ruegeria sp. THAF57]
MANLFSHVSVFLVVSNLAVFAISPDAHAAEISIASSQIERNPEPGVPFTQCNMRLDGPIEAGDADRFRSLLADIDRHTEEQWPIVTLCLNSPGGSMTEGLAIAEEIRRDRPRTESSISPLVVTRLEAGAHCASACALIFMSGTREFSETDPIPARSMHPTARLGFHAPALVVKDGDYNKAQVNHAFTISVNVIADLLRILNVGENEEGEAYSGRETWMDATLIETMLNTPASEMRYIETVDDAGRWGIDVYPLARPEINYKTAYQGCVNHWYWTEARSARNPYELHFGDDHNYPIGEAFFEEHRIRLVFEMDPHTGESCEASLDTEGYVSFGIFHPDYSGEPGLSIAYNEEGESFATDAGAHALALYSAGTRLATLSDPTPEKRAVEKQQVAWAPRFGGNKVSLWEYDGSLMAWESQGNNRWIWYFAPGDPLADSVVQSGDLLFEGKLKNGVLNGTVHHPTKSCGDLSYAISGEAKGTKVTLEGGGQPKISRCLVLDGRDETFEFSFIAAAPG